MHKSHEPDESSDLVEERYDDACGPNCTFCHPDFDPLEVLRRDGHPVLYDATTYKGEGWRADHHEQRVDSRRRSLIRRRERRVKRARWPVQD